MNRAIIFGLTLLLWAGTAQGACLASITASTPTADFTVNGNGTVTHTKTGLTWKRCSEGQVWDGVAATCTGVAVGYTWQGALQQAQALNAAGGYAGFADWRVPNIKELHSIVEEQCSLPAINAAIFPATPATGWYWSSSVYAAAPSYAWVVLFYGGGDGAGGRSGNLYVRLVRGGQ